MHLFIVGLGELLKDGWFLLLIRLRLLSAGADPNYIHPDKGNTALHVAANSNQLSQIELLLLYGADSRASDVKGKLAIDYATKAEAIERLAEAPYELTDRLTNFVCKKKAEHETGQHYLVPEMKESPETGHLSRAAKASIQAMPNHVFHLVASDVYDEVDRRETEEIWMSLQLQPQTSIGQQLVPFLPVCEMYSSTRNQGRQKLARYSAREFATLIVDIISEARRRQLGMPLIMPKPKPANKVAEALKEDSDNEPLYDSVPSDDDSDDDTLSSKKVQMKKTANGIAKKKKSPNLSPGEYNLLQTQLVRSDHLIQELVGSNKNMHHEITRLQVMVQKLIDENAQLRAVVIPTKCEPITMNHSQPARTPPTVLPRQPNCRQLLVRPQSMFEKSSNLPTKAPPLPPREDSGIGTLLSSHGTSEGNNVYGSTSAKVPLAQSECSLRLSGGGSPTYDEIEFADQLPIGLPSKEDVFRKTEQITKRIQELLSFAQDGKHDFYLPCSTKIGHTVDRMIEIFPEVCSI